MSRTQRRHGRRPKRWTGGRIALVVLAALVGLAGLALALEFGLNAGRIHPGVSVLGINLGRMTKAQAVRELVDVVSTSDDQALVVTHGERSWSARPPELGRKVDVEETVSRALTVGREGNLFASIWARFRLYFAPRSVELLVSVDSEPRDEFIATIARELDVLPMNAGLAFENGKVVVVQHKDGLVVDRTKLASTLEEYLSSLRAGEIEVPLMVAKPAIQAADTTEAVSLAYVMISGNVELRSADKNWSLEVPEIEASMACRVEGEGKESKLIPYIDPGRLVLYLGPVADAVRVPPKDATWETDGKKATVVPAVPGKELDPTATALAVDAAAKSRTNRVAEVALRDVPAKRTTEDAERMGIKEKLGEFSIGVYGSANRLMNLRRATELINGTLLAPGEEFSFNKVVGKRTAENGFNTAPVIQPDGRLEDALGGGVCQVATTLFNAAFFAGLKITERSNHMLYIDHYPMGRDAAVDYGSQDLKFVNDTDHWILIKGAVSDVVKFVIYGTSDGRKVTYTTSDWYGITPFKTQKVINPELKPGETKVKNPGQTGRSCTVKRVVTRDGKVLHNDTFYSVFPAITRVIEEPDPAATTTTTVPGTTTTTLGPPTTTTTTAPPPGTTTTT